MLKSNKVWYSCFMNCYLLKKKISDQMSKLGKDMELDEDAFNLVNRYQDN